MKLVFACLILLLAPARARALESGPVRAAIDGRHRFTVTVSAVPGTYCRLLRGDTPALCALPVDIRTGDSGSITLSDSVPVLERSFFRVERIPSAEPLDSDGDGLNDIEELAALPFRNPLNAAQTIPEADGMIYLADRAAFDAVSHRDNFPAPRACGR